MSHILVVDVVTGKQQPRRCSEREAAVGAIRREPFIAAVRADGLRHVVQVRKRVHGKAAIPDAYLSVVEPQVLVGDDALGAQCEVAGYKSAVVCGADDLIGRKRFQTYEACIAEDAAHLLRSIQKQCHGLRVPDLLGHDETPAEGREVAAAPHLFLRGLRDEEIARVPQEGSLVEVTLEGPAQKALVRGEVGAVVLLGEIVLFMYDRVVGQHTQGFEPGAVQGLVFGGREREELGQHDTVGHRYLGVLRQDTIVFYGQQREVMFQCSRFQCSSHSLVSFNDQMPDAPAVYDAARMPPRRQAFHQPVRAVAAVHVERPPDHERHADQRHENAERAVGPRHVEYHRQQQRREHPGGEEEEILRREA